MPIRLVIIDTLARAMAGADENSGEAMGLLIQQVERICAELECAVILVHHVGKDEARGMRGHSSLLGALVTSIDIKRDPDSGGRTATVAKQKDGEDGLALNFNLQTVDLGPSSDPDAEEGERDTSCVIIPEVAVDGLTRRKGSERAEMLASLIGSHCSLMSARTSFYAACGIDDPDQRRVAWNRALNELKRANRVAIDGGELWIVLPGEASK